VNAWQEKGKLALHYLGTDLPIRYLNRGDILTGFHGQPVGVVERPAYPHPEREGWWLLDVAGRVDVAPYIYMSANDTLRVGRVPLRSTNPYFLLAWETPCGCKVYEREHCEECGPYNAASPLCMNRWQQR
jgi:hypothetical protein